MKIKIPFLLFILVYSLAGVCNHSIADNVISPVNVVPATVKVDKDALVYPNPFRNIIYIDNSQSNFKEAVLTDVLGKTLLKLKLNERITKIDDNYTDFSHIPEGIYFLTLTGPGEEKLTARIVKSGK